MNEAAPAAAGEAAEERRPLLRRVPTSLLVTLLGIALTAWLLPAFTRQWDDRQKARDLKASLASAIGTATAQAVIRGREEARHAFKVVRVQHPEIGSTSLRQYPEQSRLDDLWLLDSIRIEAKLRAYFPSHVVLKQFAAYDSTMQALSLVSAAAAGASRNDLFDASSRQTTARELGIAPGDLSAILYLLHGGVHYSDPLGAVDEGYGFLTGGILGQEHKLISLIMKSHPAGYSTSTRDLVRDLIP